MLSQYLLIGPRAYHIRDPLNLETVLSTKCDGEAFFIYFLRAALTNTK